MSSDEKCADWLTRERKDYLRYFGVPHPGGTVHHDALQNFRRGRTYFIEHELRALLLEAQDRDNPHAADIDELIEKARKG